MFMLKIFDGTQRVNALLCDEQAERFLNTTARDFSNSIHVRNKVQDTLQRCIDASYEMDFKLKVYHTSAPDDTDNNNDQQIVTRKKSTEKPKTAPM